MKYVGSRPTTDAVLASIIAGLRAKPLKNRTSGSSWMLEPQPVPITASASL
ncbi:hypothetical protein AB0383_11205 [Amycolatopsis sp. NPDC051373]|uniref:hypothetical protein n=1 Tax=Amycolatopsis sp. NPDC051373 TaxID=3155801 RepID=UPI0034502947